MHKNSRARRMFPAQEGEVSSRAPGGGVRTVIDGNGLSLGGLNLIRTDTGEWAARQWRGQSRAVEFVRHEPATMVEYGWCCDVWCRRQLLQHTVRHNVTESTAPAHKSPDPTVSTGSTRQSPVLKRDTRARVDGAAISTNGIRRDRTGLAGDATATKGGQRESRRNRHRALSVQLCPAKPDGRTDWFAAFDVYDVERREETWI
ncbi:hypothetical protein F5Y12DRAFT_641967 [Xylaria sp. FL1777]|nr:hypothetical protein F5Y12DRAFT_641967 [Xylaria sp. FL1777]